MTTEGIQPPEATRVPKGSSRRTRLVVGIILFALLGYLVLSGVLYAASNRPVLNFQATLPVVLHVMAEDTTDLESIRAAYAVVIPVLQVILGHRNVEAVLSTFPDDDVKRYTFDTPATYQPAGHRDWNPLAISSGGQVDVYMVHHDGSSDRFRAFNDEGVNVFVGDEVVDPLEEAAVIMEELGHGWGLLHNPCSPIMHAYPRLVSGEIPPSATLYDNFTIDGIDIYRGAVNRALVAPASWGREVTRSIDQIAVSPAEVRVTWDVYLFESEDRAVFTQVLRVHTEDLTGPNDTDWVTLSILHLAALVRGWTASELWYISESIAGRWVDSPRPPVEC